jgi:ABC-type sugar transport system permease subunit
MNDAEPTLNLARLVRGWAFLGLVGRVFSTVVFICCGFAGLAFLFAAEAVGPGKLQVNDSVPQFVLRIAVEMVRIAACVGLMLELILLLLVQSKVDWRRLIFFVPLIWGLVGAGVAWRILFLDELDVTPKIVMLMMGAGVVFFLTTSMHATLWQASFDVAPEVSDFPYAWYLVLIMLMAAFFGGFRGWTDVSPIVRRVLDYKDQKWKHQPLPDNARPVQEPWIQ